MMARLFSRRGNGQKTKSTKKEEGNGKVPPQILLASTNSTEGIMTALTTSFDTHGDLSPQNSRKSEKKPDVCNDDSENQQDQQHFVKNQMSVISTNPSCDSTDVASVATSVSESTTTMDVRPCTSTMCNRCRSNGKEEITFITVEPYDAKMINKLRVLPPNWYQLGLSFEDLYEEANRPGRKRRSKRG